MRTWASWTDVTAVVLSLGLFTTAAQAGTAPAERYYANQTPYGDPATATVAPQGWLLRAAGAIDTDEDLRRWQSN